MWKAVFSSQLLLLHDNLFCVPFSSNMTALTQKEKHSTFPFTSWCAFATRLIKYLWLFNDCTFSPPSSTNPVFDSFPNFSRPNGGNLNSLFQELRRRVGVWPKGKGNAVISSGGQTIFVAIIYVVRGRQPQTYIYFLACGIANCPGKSVCSC